METRATGSSASEGEGALGTQKLGRPAGELVMKPQISRSSSLPGRIGKLRPVRGQLCTQPHSPGRAALLPTRSDLALR